MTRTVNYNLSDQQLLFFFNFFVVFHSPFLLLYVPVSRIAHLFFMIYNKQPKGKQCCIESTFAIVRMKNKITGAYFHMMQALKLFSFLLSFSVSYSVSFYMKHRLMNGSLFLLFPFLFSTKVKYDPIIDICFISHLKVRMQPQMA